MKWNRYTIDTTTAAVDIVSSCLGDCGIEGIEIEDNVQLSQKDIKTMFVDFIPDLPPDDGSARVSFYLDADEDNDEMLKKVKEELEDMKSFMDIGPATITISQTEDKDWINNWKQYFHPFSVGDLIIKPTWEEYTDEMKDHLVINIDPGTAFGTGSHETTQLVIRQLQKYCKKGDKVLDVGCGSGILSVVAIMLGAESALGTDLDPNAIIATKENAEVNKIENGRIEVIEGNIIDDKAVQDKADLFVSLHNNAKGEIVDYDHGCTVLVPTGNYNKEVSQQAQLLGFYFLKYLEKTGVENQGLLMRTSEKNEKYPNGKIRDYYRVIHNSIEKGIPGVIVEHSFVDNDNDVEQFLKDDSKIKKLAQADAKAIRDYCLGTVKAEKEEKQKVTLIRDSKGKNNKYSSKKFKLYYIN